MPQMADPALDAPHLDGALSVMRESAISDQQEQVSSAFDLGRFVGVAQLARTMSNFSAAAEIRAFEEINKSKAFKNLPIRHADGDFRPAENIDAFCRLVFGRGYKAMSDSKVMLQQLGEEAYENVQRLGLNRAQLRLLLTLPEDERMAVEEAMQAGGKDEVVTLIQSLANKLDETQAKVEELKGELQATEEISAEKTQRIEALQRDVKRIATAPPDRVLAELQAEATRLHNDVRGGIVGQLRQALAALHAHGETHESRPLVFMAGLVGQLEQDLLALRDEFGLPTVDRGELAWVDEA
ncbi:hypothetical protein [Thauera sp. 2A1]|uniref:hypothetical protein n=1 Tax=Thauera sp. 2A1 TaxID=2570191 RepID=UPI001290C564|nr:hypothetical protein [Thauera sp. 2A1]KAI5914602.1 hypothetical protein GH664_11695 [Thauera sp. 2A1]